MCVCLRVKCLIKIGPPNYNPPILVKNEKNYSKSAKYNSRQYFHAIR